MEGIYVFVYAFFFGLSCMFIAGEKGRSLLSFFLLGALFGPVGLVIVAMSRNNEKQLNNIDIKAGIVKKCQFCAEMIKPEAKKCKHCGSDLVKPKPATIIKTKINATDKAKIDARCSCGYVFTYPAANTGRSIACPGCKAPVVLP